MKTQALLILLLFISTFQAKAHDKITFKNKESFNTSCNDGNTCSTFDLLEITDKASLKQAQTFVKDNAAIMNATLTGTLIEFKLLTNKVDKIIYQKLFYQMGLIEIEILEGDAKGTYTVEEFLNLYNL